MSDKVIKKTKAQLHEMLAEAVRNTQPQPINAQPEAARQADPNPSPPIGPKLMLPEIPSDNSVVYQDGRPSHSFNRAQRSYATDARNGKR